jgi:anoctamin-10/anoctamin-7
MDELKVNILSENDRENQLPISNNNINIDNIDDFITGYDFCIVCPANSKGNLSKAASGHILKLKNKLCLDVYCYLGVNKKFIFVLIKASLQILRNFSNNHDYRLLLDEVELEKKAKSGNPARGIAPINVSHKPDIVRHKPYENIYCKYSSLVDENLYWKEEGENSPFRQLVRLKITALVIEMRPGKAENIKMDRYIKKGDFSGYYCLHDSKKVEALKKKLLFSYATFPWNEPLDDIKDYFGEKIGVYYGWMGHYTYWLVLPLIVGIPIQGVVWGTDNYSSIVVPCFAYFIALWAVFMLEFWKRKQATIAQKWGQMDYEETEGERPDFKAKTIKSFVDGSKLRFFPEKERQKLSGQSFLAVFILICLVIGIVSSIYFIKDSLVKDTDLGDDLQVRTNNAQTIASTLNSVQITIANMVYTFLAYELNNRENHRTETEYNDALILKIFLFQFVNSYASFFYIAFIEGGAHVMESLSTNLAIIYGVRLSSGLFSDIVLPLLMYKWNLRKNAEGVKKMTSVEQEFLLEPYNGNLKIITQYAEIAIQFGYTALFASALPIASLFGFFSNWINLKATSWKLLNLYQRPVPTGAADIGSWGTIYLAIAICAVLTNAGLAVFTCTTFDHHTQATRFWIFIIFQWSCFILQALVMEAIPDIPEAVLIQQERAEFFNMKIIDEVPDDEEIKLEKGKDKNLIVHSCIGGQGIVIPNTEPEVNVPDNTSPLHMKDSEENNDNIV